MLIASPANRRSRPASPRNRPPAPARADHLVAVIRPPTVRSPMRDGKRLLATVGWRSTSTRHLLQLTPSGQRRGSRPCALTSRCIFGGLPSSSTSIGMSIGALAGPFFQHQLLASVATPTTRTGSASRSQIAWNSGSASARHRHHVTLLALVAPDLLRRQAALLQRHLAQIETRATPGAVHQFRERRC